MVATGVLLRTLVVVVAGVADPALFAAALSNARIPPTGDGGVSFAITSHVACLSNEPLSALAGEAVVLKEAGAAILTVVVRAGGGDR